MADTKKTRAPYVHTNLHWGLLSVPLRYIICDGGTLPAGLPGPPEAAILVVECCFTSTETVGLIGTGAQDGHFDFHTAPEL